MTKTHPDGTIDVDDAMREAAIHLGHIQAGYFSDFCEMCIAERKHLDRKRP